MAAARSSGRPRGGGVFLAARETTGLPADRDGQLAGDRPVPGFAEPAGRFTSYHRDHAGWGGDSGWRPLPAGRADRSGRHGARVARYDRVLDREVAVKEVLLPSQLTAAEPAISRHQATASRPGITSVRTAAITTTARSPSFLSVRPNGIPSLSSARSAPPRQHRAPAPPASPRWARAPFLRVPHQLTTMAQETARSTNSVR
jgi:hypothetical protein